MKVVHWSPIENKSSILRDGIIVKDSWSSGTILTPFKNLNRWWLDFKLNDKEYLGFIFELNETDFPLVFDHWVIDSYTKLDENFDIIEKKKYSLSEIQTHTAKSVYSNKKELTIGFKNEILWRMGSNIKIDRNDFSDSNNEKDIALKFIKDNPKKSINEFINSPNFLEFTFEDYQLLFFKNIEANRIEKVIKSNTNYKYSTFFNEVHDLILKK